MLEPLSSLLRPNKIENLAGQKDVVGPISSFLESKYIPSMLFRGPAGTGKTTLARIIAKKLDAQFRELSGVSSKKDDLKQIIKQAEINFNFAKASIVFLDEIHRRNKAQQDTLLPFVEKGIITLIGATTENPGFSINNALLSRCRTFVFKRLGKKEIFDFIKNNLDKIYKKYPNIKINDEVIKMISKLANGDLRNGLNILESSILHKNKGQLKLDDIQKNSEKNIYYDRNGEEHYNVISAFIKSMRGSDVNATCYRLQRMIKSGEYPLFIARRMIIFASEDIGLENTNALLIANQIFDSVQKVGLPEAEFMLFHGAIFLAKSKKSNKVYKAIQGTRRDVEEKGNLDVPKHLRNASTQFMQEQGYGEGYEYAHDYKDAKINQQHLPDELKGRIYFD
ncbi:MAG TPA: replication-associated recombination protein A [Candidatus Absconditabacterales bacterium]|nr:replication-associated recombination protein A [Candidatus Absconditabacterales bacterium]